MSWCRKKKLSLAPPPEAAIYGLWPQGGSHTQPFPALGSMIQEALLDFPTQAHTSMIGLVLWGWGKEGATHGARHECSLPFTSLLASSSWGWEAFLAMNPAVLTPGSLPRKHQVLSSLWSKKSLSFASGSLEVKSHFTTMGRVVFENP